MTRPARRLPQFVAVLVCALLGVAGLVVAPAALAADPQIEPTAASNVAARPGETVTFQLDEVMTPQSLELIDRGSLHLVAATDDSHDPSGEGRTMVTPGGTWTLGSDDSVTFTPANDTSVANEMVALGANAKDGTELDALALTATYPDLADQEIEVSQGSKATFNVMADATEIDSSTLVLVLDDMPAETTLTSDGRRMVVPGEGVWRVGVGGSITFSPFTDLSAPPTPVRYSGKSQQGYEASPATLTVRTPTIPDLTNTATWGSPVDFALGPELLNVDFATLTFLTSDLPEGTEIVRDSSGARELRVPDQGTWTLDREAEKVTFSPSDSSVRVASPVYLRGNDAEGNSSRPARLEVGYPSLDSQWAAAQPGHGARFDVLATARNVDATALQFGEEGQPAGAQASDENRTLTVSGQGTWRIDEVSGSVSFTPSDGFTRSPDPVTVSALDEYGTNLAAAVLTATYSSTVPQVRSDRLTVPGLTGGTVALLDNDAPSGAQSPLDPESLELHSTLATNTDELRGGSGRRLVIPDEGTFTVDSAGRLTVQPSAAMAGRTVVLQYTVQDAEGISVSGQVTVQVTTEQEGPAPSADAGWQSLLTAILDPGGRGFAVYVTITALMLFAGSVGLFIGRVMAIDRHRAARNIRR